MEKSSFSWSIESSDALDDLATDWDAINSVGKNLPISDAKFFQLLRTEFASGDERLAICRNGDSIVAAALIRSHRMGAWQTYQPAQAPLGAWIQRPELSPEQLLSSLLNDLPGISLVIGSTQLDPWVLPRPEENKNLISHDYIKTARIPVSGSFDEYWSKRGRNLRQNLKRQRNRLKRESVETRLQIITSADAVGEAVDKFGRLESAGWKAENGTALHPDNSQGRFYRSLLEDYSRRSEGIVFEYYYNDILAASDLCLSRDGVVYILKTTHDETQKGSSPAMLMRQEAFERIFDDGGYSQIEFYGKVMDWHTKWSDDIRVLYHLTYYRWPVLSRIGNRDRS